MCRFFTYLGPATTLEALIIAPQHSLIRQSWAPRHQHHGLVNADGFGCGWYAPNRSAPAVYRTTRPAWGDRNFASFAGAVESTAVVAAVRDATPGFAVEEASTAPFTDGDLLFAHNGEVKGHRDPGGAGVALRRCISDRRLAGVEGSSDSAILFALTLDRLDVGATLGEALVDVIDTVRTHTSARLNLVLTDGQTIAATAFGDTLFTLRAAGLAGTGVIVASEPCDDDLAWEPVPDDSLVLASADHLTITRGLHP